MHFDFLQSAQLLSRAWLSVTPWTSACQASLSITNSRSSLKLMSIESVCHPTISSSVVSSSCLQSFPASGSFPVSQFFISGGQSIRASASASVLPVNIQDWFPLRLTGLLSLYQSIIDVGWWGRGAIFMMMSHHFIELAFFVSFSWIFPFLPFKTTMNLRWRFPLSHLGG